MLLLLLRFKFPRPQAISVHLENRFCRKKSTAAYANNGDDMLSAAFYMQPETEQRVGE